MKPVTARLQPDVTSERVSELVDGEMSDARAAGMLLAGLNQAEQAAWTHFHLIGDVLRSNELALQPAVSEAFLCRIRAQLTVEPHLCAPAGHGEKHVRWPHRRAIPALTAAAAVAALSWVLLPQFQDRWQEQQMLSGRTDKAYGAAQTSLPSRLTHNANIIRDADLDQYREAHQQFAQQPVVTGSMSAIRPAALTVQGQ